MTTTDAEKVQAFRDCLTQQEQHHRDTNAYTAALHTITQAATLDQAHTEARRALDTGTPPATVEAAQAQADQHRRQAARAAYRLINVTGAVDQLERGGHLTNHAAHVLREALANTGLQYLPADTPPLTDWERSAVATYELETAGTHDCFGDECFGPGSYPDGWTIDDKLGLMRGLLTMLGTWYEQLDSLYTGLDRHRQPPYEGARFSAAGYAYLRTECTQWMRALHLVRRETCRLLLGTAGPQPEMDSGHLTFCDVVGVQVDGTVCAESR